MTEENQLLLKEYSTFKNAYQLVLKDTENGNNLVDYYLEIIEKFSTKKITHILEIYPVNEESFQVSFRKAGFEVTSIALDMRISAVGGEQDGDHFIIGKNFDFPKLPSSQKFDVVIISQGCFGRFVSEENSREFLTKIFECLEKNGLLIFEFWHLTGVEKAVTDEKGHKDWEKINSVTEGSIIRLTNSKLHLDTSLLSVDIHYIIENNNEIKRFNESHLWRLYTLSEIDLLLGNNNFQFLKSYKFPTFEDPEFTSFRLLGICERK